MKIFSARASSSLFRAETATDPAPFDMIETTIMLRDEKDWPAVDIKDSAGTVLAHRRRTVDELVDALNASIQIPGLTTSAMPSTTEPSSACARRP